MNKQTKELALAAEEDMDNTILDVADDENDLVVKLSKPYTFEGSTYTEIDLSGLEDATGGMLVSVGKIVAKKNPGINQAVMEMSLPFAQHMAARVTGKPLEFFMGLPIKDTMELKGKVVNFLFGGDGQD